MLIETFAEIIGGVAALAGVSSVVGLHIGRKYHTITTAQIISVLAPAPRERDEFLLLLENENRLVELAPREFVPDGQNPVAAARARSRAEGRIYQTRRVMA